MGNLKDHAVNFIDAKKESQELVSELKSLRIDEKTVIQVPREKCNEKYRQEWIERMNAKQYRL
jgi:hypothetical protein